VLEKVTINTINHHVYTNGYINNDQYGFTTHVSTIDAIMAIKEFVGEGFRKGKVTAIVSLDVEAAFNSAWWPSTLKSLKESGCPQNLYDLIKSYFNQQTESLLTGSREKYEKEFRKTLVAAPAFGIYNSCGPGLWIIQLPPKHQIYEPDKSHRLCRQLNTDSKRQNSEKSR
jgi:hypothetical protein